MGNNKGYNIEEFYIGELYLYTNFAKFLSESYNPKNQSKINTFAQSRAINFQQDMESRYIDWENGREYAGFLTIFYKQGNKYVCLHDGISYEINGSCFIKNLVPLNELLPKVNSKVESCISIARALELFDILFKKEESQLYNENKQSISDFYVGDLVLREMFHQETLLDSTHTYINLPNHVMLDKSGLAIQSFNEGTYVNRVYRCLFLKDGVDLYNVNNHQFYNPNEDTFQMIVNFKDYTTEYGINVTAQQISIPKALKKFKKTF